MHMRGCLLVLGLLLVAPTMAADSNVTSSWYSFIWPLGWWVAYYGFGLIIGSFVLRDAKNRIWLFLGIRPIWWLFLVLFDPALGLLAYWATQYSKLAQNYSEAIATRDAIPPT
jgi:hypothetical protein